VNASDDVLNKLRRQAETGDPQATKSYADALSKIDPAEAGRRFVEIFPHLGPNDYTNVKSAARLCYDTALAHNDAIQYGYAARLFEFLYDNDPNLLDDSESKDYRGYKMYAFLLANGLGTKFDIEKAIAVLYSAIRKYGSREDLIDRKNSYENDGVLWEQTGNAKDEDDIQRKLICYNRAIECYVTKNEFQKAALLYKNTLRIAPSSREKAIATFKYASVFQKTSSTIGDPKYNAAIDLFVQLGTDESAPEGERKLALRAIFALPEPMLVETLYNEKVLEAFAHSAGTLRATCYVIKVLLAFIHQPGAPQELATHWLNERVKDVQNCVPICREVKDIRVYCSWLEDIRCLSVDKYVWENLSSWHRGSITGAFSRGLNNVLARIRQINVTTFNQDFETNCPMLLWLKPLTMGATPASADEKADLQIAYDKILSYTQSRVFIDSQGRSVTDAQELTKRKKTVKHILSKNASDQESLNLVLHDLFPADYPVQ
jgi:hypothetical protein